MTTFTSPPHSPGSRTPQDTLPAPSAMSSIWLIAQREISTRARTKSFVITTGVLMAVMSRSGGDWKMRAVGDGFKAKTPRAAEKYLGRYLE